MFAKEMVDDTRPVLNDSQDLGVQGSGLEKPMAAMGMNLSNVSNAAPGTFLRGCKKATIPPCVSPTEGRGSRDPLRR